jgi:hypothetical protein
MLDGDIGGLLHSLLWTGYRTALIATGMYMSGEREDLLQKGLAGSLAVQAFVTSWAAFGPPNERATLPSYSAALSGKASLIAGTYLARSALIYTGLRIAGKKKRSVVNALAGAAIIELSVLSTAAAAKRLAKRPQEQPAEQSNEQPP